MVMREFPREKNGDLKPMQVIVSKSVKRMRKRGFEV